MLVQLKYNFPPPTIFAEIEAETFLDGVQKLIENQALLRCADLTNLQGDELDFIEARLEEADLSGSKFTNSYFFNAILRRTKMLRCDFSGSDFSDADLTGADVSASDFSGANFDGVKLIGAKLTSAILPDRRTFQTWRERPLATMRLHRNEIDDVFDIWDSKRHRYVRRDRNPLFDVMGWSTVDDVPDEAKLAAITFVALFVGGHLRTPRVKRRHGR